MSKQYEVSACLLIKDEGRYLPEWLEWHWRQGVEHFYLYDNGSAIPVGESVPAEYENRVTVVDFPPPRESTQREAYADCLARFGSETEWMAFLDTDEFLRVVDGRPLPDFLKEYPEADAVLAKWVIYNANGLLEDDGGLVRERFTRIADLYPSEMPQCKSIVRAGRVSVMGAHGPIAANHSLWVVNESHERVRQGGGELPAEKIVVDHYFTRSLSEWREKMARGSCDPDYSRDDGWFWRMNPDLSPFRAVGKEEKV